VPGLSNEIELMAWKHRRQNPFIIALTSEGDVECIGIRI